MSFHLPATILLRLGTSSSLASFSGSTKLLQKNRAHSSATPVVGENRSTVMLSAPLTPPLSMLFPPEPPDPPDPLDSPPHLLSPPPLNPHPPPPFHLHVLPLLSALQPPLPPPPPPREEVQVHSTNRLRVIGYELCRTPLSITTIHHNHRTIVSFASPTLRSSTTAVSSPRCIASSTSHSLHLHGTSGEKCSISDLNPNSPITVQNLCFKFLRKDNSLAVCVNPLKRLTATDFRSSATLDLDSKLRKRNRLSFILMGLASPLSIIKLKPNKYQQDLFDHSRQSRLFPMDVIHGSRAPMLMPDNIPLLSKLVFYRRFSTPSFGCINVGIKSDYPMLFLATGLEIQVKFLHDFLHEAEQASLLNDFIFRFIVMFVLIASPLSLPPVVSSSSTSI